MRLLVLVCLLASCVVGIHDKYITVDSYHGYTVLRVLPTTKEQVSSLLELQEEMDILDFWSEPGLNRNVDIMVIPEGRVRLESLLRQLGIEVTVYIQDVERLIEEERMILHEQGKKADGNFSLYTYHEYPEIVAHLEELAASNPDIETEVIGQSWEGRDMVLLKICRGGCGNKPAIWIDGGIHAREWISPATALWTIHEVLGDEFLIDNSDWYILPVLNPDGYTFTHQHTRLWRKTRSYHNSLLGCRGTDGNRNFGFHWNEGGSSADKCFDTYHGPDAFSEPETAAVRDFILAREGKVKYYNNMHSYSQFVLLSWGYTTDPPPNYMDFFSVADTAMEKLTAVNGTEYTIGCIPCMLYVASGGASDWALGVAEVPFSYSMELRDTGRHGFLLPPEFIEPVGRETWQFHKSVAMEVVARFGSV